MRISILITILTSMLCLNASAQEMSWVASKYVPAAQCDDLSDCEGNMVCYNLKYEPGMSGTLTSYTSSFIVNCNNNLSAVKSNSSCTMNDNSNQKFACESKGLILLHCSANEGEIPVVKDQAVYLHQICIQMDKQNDNIVFEGVDMSQPTTSITRADGVSQTEYINYKNFMFMNSELFCGQTAAYLTLEAELVSDEAHLTWEPAREIRDGIYTLFHSLDGQEFTEVETFESKMLSQGNTYKYKHNLELEDFGSHLFKVTYGLRNSDPLKSNVSEIYYKDLRFSMSLAPNPTADRIKIHVTSDDSEVEMRISNLNGKVVMRKIIKTDEDTWHNLDILTPGMYTVSVFSKNDQISEKVILIN